MEAPRVGGGTRYCGGCGAPCPAHSKYCTSCGTPLSASGGPTLGPPTPTSSSPSPGGGWWAEVRLRSAGKSTPASTAGGPDARSATTTTSSTSSAASCSNGATHSPASRPPVGPRGRQLSPVASSYASSSSSSSGRGHVGPPSSSSSPSGALLWPYLAHPTRLFFFFFFLALIIAHAAHTPTRPNGAGRQLKRTHSAGNVREEATASSSTSFVSSSSSSVSTTTTAAAAKPASGGGGKVASRWPPVATYATMRPARAAPTATVSARAPSGWTRNRNPSLVSSASSSSSSSSSPSSSSSFSSPSASYHAPPRPPRTAPPTSPSPPPASASASAATARTTSPSTAARAEERQGQGPEQAKPQEAGQALWAKVQVGLRAAIDDARRRGGSSGSADLFTPAQAQEKHTLALRSHNDSFSFRQYERAELGFQGKSGSFLFVSGDERLVIKTISVTESKYLRKILLAYYEHTTHPTEKSFLVRFVGMYRIQATEQATILVMTNAFGTAERIDERYDLKGSTLGRKTLFSCKLDTPVASLMLKDLDLVDRFRIKLGRERKKRFLHILTYDAEFLERFGIIDYSLLLGVHFVDVSEEHKRPRGPLGADVLHAEDGGIWSSNDQREALRAIYYCAVIDILQPYNMRKQLEHNLKSVVHDKQAISVCPPTLYVSRFLHFIGTYIE
ncbi:Phosphatidylinositol4-phosphate 5-Kinase [Acanthamoeba castellanii str. Neff]|uniref:Phosphatidylinositol4-phosphate 5-Kinase n=1 Tax=Acanthamoeba castellanii (strain ATCC 30010 / Neff) TaxID=1257118 RepID=L8GT46_ACACF|nr:Phosphatidylinositol4-phosphate 5-Kinase [Acanthamoeba castellanii str. Neff]ELR16160.1 Phosphatidylinositol4-phosphate 5-Kinase [Acanthamoeba castellanii str. Neff]